MCWNNSVAASHLVVFTRDLRPKKCVSQVIVIKLKDEKRGAQCIRGLKTFDHSPVSVREMPVVCDDNIQIGAEQHLNHIGNLDGGPKGETIRCRPVLDKQTVVFG